MSEIETSIRVVNEYEGKGNEIEEEKTQSFKKIETKLRKTEAYLRQGNKYIVKLGKI